MSRGGSKRLSSDERAETKRRRNVNSVDEDTEAALSLAEYLNIDKLLNEDIEVGGVRLRTGDIIGDVVSDNNDSNFMTLSPPSSDDTNDSFEDLLGGELTQPAPSSSGTVTGRGRETEDAAGMSIQGVKIEPPEWWSESLTGNSFNGIFVSESEADSHPWSSNKSDIDDAIAALDDMEKFLSSSFN